MNSFLSNSSIQILVENTLDSVLIIDTEHKLRLCNSAGRRILEANGKKVVIGTDVRQYFQEQNLPFYLEGFEKAIRGESTLLDQSRMIDGHENWLRHCLKPLHNPQNEFIGVTLITSIIDKEKVAIKEKEAAQHLLQERMKELQTLYGTSNILLKDDQSFQEALSAITKTLPAGWQHSANCTARIVFDGAEHLSENYTQPISVQSAEFITCDKKKGLIEIGYIDAQPAADEGPFLKEERALLNSLCELLTVHYNRELLELERKTIISDLLQRNKDLEEFAFIISHNIRGPLANILGLAGLFSYGLEPEDTAKALEGIQTSARRLDRVLADLNTTLQSRRTLTERKARVELSALMQEVLSGLEHEIVSSNALIQYDFPVDAALITTKSALLNIFINIITNSIKFAKPGERPTIKIWSEIVGHQVTIYFEDKGIGMDLDRYGEQLFGLYKRFTEHIEGKGMGLFMAKTQASIIGGKLKAESRVNEGMKMVLTLQR